MFKSWTWNDSVAAGGRAAAVAAVAEAVATRATAVPSLKRQCVGTKTIAFFVKSGYKKIRP
jgi:hypothetical protein